MKGKNTTTGPSFEHGVYEAVCERVECYTSPNFNTKEPEVNLTFVWNLGENPDKPGEDLIFYDGFNTLYQDDEGYPVIGGKRGKMFKRLYGLYGKDFDPYGEDLDWEITFPKDYDDPEALADLPTWDSYERGEEKLRLRSLKVEGKELIGQECMIELGHAQKPDGTFSTRTSVIDAKPLPKRRPSRKAKAEVEEESEELPV